MAIVGRERPADIVVPAPQVSACHLEIQPLGGGVYSIRDLGSSNGTRVNGRRVSSAQVTAADDIRLGSFRFDLGAYARQLGGVPQPPPPLPAAVPHPYPARAAEYAVAAPPRVSPSPAPSAARAAQESRRVAVTAGILLLAAFLLPLVGERGRLSFPNMEVLSVPGVPGIVVALMLYPLAAGIVALALAGRPITPARAVVLAATGLLPPLVAAARLMAAGIAIPIPIPLGSLTFLLILFAVSTIALPAGAYAVRAGHRGAAGPILAAIGGGAYCLGLLIAVVQVLQVMDELRGPFGGPLFPEAATRAVTTAGAVWLVGTGLMLLASISALVAVGRRGDVRSANRVLGGWLGAQAWSLVCVLVGSLLVGGPDGANPFLVAVKFICAAVGLQALVVLGVGEMVLTLAADDTAPRSPEYAAG